MTSDMDFLLSRMTAEKLDAVADRVRADIAGVNRRIAAGTWELSCGFNSDREKLLAQIADYRGKAVSE